MTRIKASALANSGQRKEFNLARQKIGGVFPEAGHDPLPPQPSILPATPQKDPKIVRIARKVDIWSHRLGPVRKLPSTAGKIVRRRQRQTVNLPVFKSEEYPAVSIVIPVYNKFHLTLQCLQSLQQHIPATIATEVIIVDNASTDSSTQLAKAPGLIYIRNTKNEGFVGGCNAGAAAAKGEYIVFLNNDASVTEGWLEPLLETLKTYPGAGLIGSKIIYPDGRLQEAGGIIYRDGSGSNYGKNDHPSRYQYNYVREVDYCSGASIIISAKLFHEFGGFDELYAPAYYEDTDLAFKIREKGLKVVYQPKSVIYHIEGGTSGTDTSVGFKRFQEINKQKFLKRWGATLRKKHQLPADEFLARDRSHSKTALIFDEQIPTPDQDSGSVRMVRMLRVLQELDYKITFYPVSSEHTDYAGELQQLGIEVVYGPHDAKRFLKTNGKYFDLVVLSRPRVGSFFLDLCQAFCTNAKILYDTVDLHYLRLGRQSALEIDPEEKQYFAAMARTHEVIEKKLIRETDCTLLVSEAEQKILAKDGFTSLAVVSNIHMLVPEAYKVGYNDRSDLVFVGGFQHTPNIDSIEWYVEKIHPLVREQLPNVRLRVVGSRMPEDLQKRLKAINGVTVDGFLSDEDLHTLLTQSRLMVSPLLYGAGVKGKIGQAIEYGLPVVTTTIGAEGMHLTDGVSGFVADSAEAFADKVVAAYSDREQWQRIQSAAQQIIDKHFSATAAREALQKVLR